MKYYLLKNLGFLAIMAMLAGCMGRQAEVKDYSHGDLSLIRNQKITTLYIVPFDVSSVELKGDHGDASERTTNKNKWFSHVYLGAMNGLSDTDSEIEAIVARGNAITYEDWLMNKTKKKFKYQGNIPTDSYTITGKYIVADEISGAARAFLGVMSGKTWTRAKVKIKRGSKVIYTGTIDGKYMGSGYSWGYESLGANEGLGREIVAIVQRLQKGTN